MKKYHEALLKMKNDGAPMSLISEMTDLDPEEGLQMAQFIIDSGDLENISELYRQRDEIAQEMAEEFYQPDIDALHSGTVSKITAEYESLPAEFYDIGHSAIENLYLGMTDAAGDMSGLLEMDLGELELGASAGLEGLDMKGILSANASVIAEKAQAVFTMLGASLSHENTGHTAEDLSAGFSRMIDAVKEIKIFNQTTSQLLLDGKVTAESVNNYNDTLGRMADI